MTAIFWASLDGAPDHLAYDTGYSGAALVAWVPDAYCGDTLVDVIQGPVEPPMQGPWEPCPF